MIERADEKQLSAIRVWSEISSAVGKNDAEGDAEGERVVLFMQTKACGKNFTEIFPYHMVAD